MIQLNRGEEKVGDKDDNEDKEKHNVVVQIHDFFHDDGCWFLEVHLSGARDIQKDKATYFDGAGEGTSNDIEEEEGGDGGDDGTDGGNIISSGIGVGVIRDTARHTGEAEEVHGEEGEIDSDKEGSEMDFSKKIVIAQADKFFNSVVEARENSEDGSHRKDIVEMGNDVVGIMKGDVHACIGKNDSGDASNGKEKDKAKSEDERGAHVERSSSESRQSAKDFNSRRNGNNHRGRREVGARVHIEANGVHVMGSYNEAKETDGEHGVDHSQVAKDRFVRVTFDDVANDSKAGKNKNVDFGMSEESEEMLI